MSAEITPGRIAELRTQFECYPGGIRRVHVAEVFDALESSRAEVQRLREEASRSDAGRVEVPEMGPGDLCIEFFPEDALGNEDVNYRETVKGINAWFRTRLSPSPQPSADVVVVPREEWSELRAFARLSGYPEGRFSYEVPFEKDFAEWGADIAHRLGITREEEQAWLDALRSSTNHDSKETP